MSVFPKKLKIYSNAFNHNLKEEEYNKLIKWRKENEYNKLIGYRTKLENLYLKLWSRIKGQISILLGIY